MLPVAASSCKDRINMFRVMMECMEYSMKSIFERPIAIIRGKYDGVKYYMIHRGKISEECKSKAMTFFYLERKNGRTQRLMILLLKEYEYAKRICLNFYRVADYA